jgi:acyl-CoA reductase-like NAD-dependent aldehyde dehydrogenase
MQPQPATQKIFSRNPATGELLAELEPTPLSELPLIFARAREAQSKWAAVSVKKRAHLLRQLREVMIDRAEEIAELISKENGKPRFEALASEVFSPIDTITYFADRAPALLKDKNIPLVFMRHRKSKLNYWPLGVVAVIAPWNFPLMLPLSTIVIALLCGNAVVFKPSEITPLVGLKIQELCEAAGLPANIIQTVIGDGSVGAAIIDQRPAKIFFTGSTATGRKIMKAAAEHLIPVNLELGGKDAMIVLADADLDFATSCAVWGGYSNAGQFCAATERVLVHESIAQPFTTMLKEKLKTLRQGPSSGLENDLGPITFHKQAAVYEEHLNQAHAAGVQFPLGGALSSDRRYMPPAIVAGSGVEKLEIYNEETFGPVVAITTFRSITEAIEKANRSKYGLLASVITKNISMGEEIARQLEVGTVTINEVAYTGGLAETPWGGLKESGFGRVRSEMGIYEFVNVRHIHKPRSRLLVFKSAWWFPYTPYQYETFKLALQLYRRSWVDRVRAFPHFLWNLVQFLKKEKRL